MGALRERGGTGDQRHRIQGEVPDPVQGAGGAALRQGRGHPPRQGNRRADIGASWMGLPWLLAGRAIIPPELDLDVPLLEDIPKPNPARRALSRGHRSARLCGSVGRQRRGHRSGRSASNSDCRRDCGNRSAVTAWEMVLPRPGRAILSCCYPRRKAGLPISWPDRISDGPLSAVVALRASYLPGNFHRDPAIASDRDGARARGAAGHPDRRFWTTPRRARGRHRLLSAGQSGLTRRRASSALTAR